MKQTKTTTNITEEIRKCVQISKCDNDYNSIINVKQTNLLNKIIMFLIFGLSEGSESGDNIYECVETCKGSISIN
jgi:hypothetical protein